MPLISCPDCGAQVSDTAPSCVKCGRPIAAAARAQRPPKAQRGCLELGPFTTCLALGFVLLVAAAYLWGQLARQTY